MKSGLQHRELGSSSTPARLPGLEGLRAIAVLAVLAYHGEISGLLPAGFLGVDIFFVLSGFLITSLLLKEHAQRGALDLGGFYVRRAKRLLPALLAMLAMTACVTPWLAPDALPRLREDLPAALLYASNGWQIVSAQSYFEAFARPPLLQHLWSLAIEEQFYLVWPLLVLGLLRLGGRRGVALFSLAAAVLATVWMARLAVAFNMPEAQDPSRVYLGTDTHCMGLLVGAALAACIDPWRQAAAADVRWRGPARDGLGVIALLGLLAVMVWGHDGQAWLYRGGFLLVALATAALLWAAVQPGSRLQPLLGSAPLRWIGERSYGLYVWHWPVFVLLRPRLELPADPWLALAIRLAITFVLAELSYRYVEMPVRSGRFAAWSRRQWASAALASAAGLAGVAVVYLHTPQPGQAPAGFGSTIVEADPTAVEAEIIAAFASAGPAAGAAQRQRAPGALSETERGLTIDAPAGPATLSAFGESVLLSLRDPLLRSLPGVQLDAEVGRSSSRGLTRVREMKASNQLAATVLLHIGNNGYLSEAQLRSALAELADRERVLLVTVRVPKRWEAHNNDLLERVGKEFPNTVLVDWARVSADHPEYFVSDGVHLTSAGIRRLTEEIRRQARAFPIDPARTASLAVQPPAPDSAPRQIAQANP